jgi:hypothetical protein
MKRKALSAVLLLAALSMLLPAAVSAAVVGRLTQVEGKVDFLKQGKLPSTPAKLDDGVEPGDVIRTKSLSKAQITFKDGSTVTISPGSRIAVEEYLADTGKSRHAVLKFFQGVALAVVSKIYQAEKPNFIIKTHTAIMGIRGTEVGIRLHPNSSTFLNFEGRTRIESIFPEIQGVVELGKMQGSTVERGLPPTLPFEVSDKDREQFMRQLATGLNVRKNADEASSEGNQLGNFAGDSPSVSITPPLKPGDLQPVPTSTSPPSPGGGPPPPVTPPAPPVVVSGPPYGPPSPPTWGPPGQSFQPPGPPPGPAAGGPPYGHAYGNPK